MSLEINQTAIQDNSSINLSVHNNSLTKICQSYESVVKNFLTFNKTVNNDITNVTNHITNNIQVVQGAAEAASGGAISALKSVGGAFLELGQAALGGIKAFVDSAESTGRLKQGLHEAAGSQQEFAAAQAELQRVAQASSISLASTGEAFTQLLGPMRQLGGSSRDAGTMLESFSAGMRLNGQSATEQSEAMKLLAETMQSGAVKAENFNKLVENSPALLKAMQAETGKSAEELQHMAEAGKLGSEVIGNSLIHSFGAVTEQANQLPDTVSGALIRLQNDVTSAVDDINTSSGLTLGVASLVEAARGLVPLLRDEVGAAFQSVGDWIGRNREAIHDLWVGVQGVAGGVWDVIKAIAGVVGMVAEWLLQSREVAVALQYVRIVLAALADGVQFVGALLQGLGGLILTSMAKPMTLLLSGIGELASLIDRDLGSSIKNAGASMAALGASMTASAASVFENFASGKSHLAKLKDEITGTGAATTSLSTSTAAHAAIQERVATTLSASTDAVSKHTSGLGAAISQTGLLSLSTNEVNSELERFAQKSKATPEVLAAQKAALDEAQAATKALGAEQLSANSVITDSNQLVEAAVTQTDSHGKALEGLTGKLKAAAESRKEDKSALEKWREEFAKIPESLSEKLSDAITKGESLADVFKTGLKNAVGSFKKALVDDFSKLVLKPSIQAILAPVTGAIGAFLGVGSANAATPGGGTPGSSGLDWLTNFGGAFNQSIGSLGDYLVQSNPGGLGGLGAWLKGTAESGAAGKVAGFLGDAAGYLSAFSNAANGKWGAAAGSAIGTAFGGPLGSAIGGQIGGLLDRAFGGDGIDFHGADWVSTSGGGGYRPGRQEVGPSARDFSVNEGRSSDVEASVKRLADAGVFALDALGAVSGLKTQWKVGTFFTSQNADSKNSRGTTSIWRDGQRLFMDDNGSYDKKAAPAFEQYSKDFAADLLRTMRTVDLPNWAKKQLDALSPTTSAADLEKFASQLVATKQLLAGLGETFTPLGGVFARVANLSADATMQLAQFAGGIDALVGKTKAYVDAYYTDEEKASLQASGIKKALQNAGFDVDLHSKRDFRNLVDRQQVDTEEGRKQLAALLDIANAFAGLGSYLETNKTSLNALAALAPNAKGLAGLGTTQEQANAVPDKPNPTTEAVNTVSDRIGTSNSLLQKVVDAIGNGNSAVGGLLGKVLGAALAANEAAAVNNQLLSTANARLDNIESNGALSRSAPSYGSDIGRRQGEP